MSRVLVADQAAEEDRYRAFLKLHGCEVVFYTEGQQASQMLEDSAAAIDLVIVLWELSGPLSGTELVRRCRRLRATLPVIVVSGHLDHSRAAAAERIGAKDFLLKPLDGERLRGAIDCLLRPQADSPLVESLRSRLIGDSPALLNALRSLAAVIPDRTANVLLVGESGTGKELLARAVHELGPDAGEPFISVNLTEIPETLLESRLFGHEAGAFTDAKKERRGCFEECQRGTLFLDEIGELDIHLQAKLLRVIEARTFRPLGGDADKTFSARLVTATNRDLAVASKKGLFRDDLYYRIATHEIHVPPLRERGDDLWLLAEYFLAKYGGEGERHLGREARCLLSAYPFPGNIREFEDVIQGALLRCGGPEILPFHLPLDSLDRRSPEPTGQAAPRLAFPEHLFRTGLKEATEEIVIALDREYLPRILAHCQNKLTLAAKMAAVDKNTFKARWQRAGLQASPWQE